MKAAYFDCFAGASGDMILGFISNNAGDNWLHVVLAIVLLAAGFAMADRQMSPAM